MNVLSPAPTPNLVTPAQPPGESNAGPDNDNSFRDILRQQAQPSNNAAAESRPVAAKATGQTGQKPAQAANTDTTRTDGASAADDTGAETAVLGNGGTDNKPGDTRLTEAKDAADDMLALLGLQAPADTTAVTALPATDALPLAAALNAAVTATNTDNATETAASLLTGQDGSQANSAAAGTDLQHADALHGNVLRNAAAAKRGEVTTNAGAGFQQQLAVSGKNSEADSLTAATLPEHEHGGSINVASVNVPGATNQANTLAFAPALQQLQTGARAANNMPGGSQIGIPLGRPGWDQALSQKIVWLAGSTEQSATLTLSPPDLGPLQVVIRVHNDQADASFFSQNADVRRALENSLGTLSDMMNQAGISLGQTNISAEQQPQQFAQQMQQARAGDARTNNSDGESRGTTQTTPTRRMQQGLVDTFA